MAASLDVCSTEDAVQVFLQHLVDPFLPEKSSVRDNPTLSQQQLIAKQVHSVVLLYNYYHRKHHPELEYLPFNEFCKLSVVLRPALLAYMQFMQKVNEVELIDVEKQLSLTEKVIMDACDVCKRLDASKNVPNIEGWPVSKVAILLIDSKKEKCFLLFGSITSGVWSVVEKSVDTSSQNSEVTSGTKFTYKRKRVVKKPAKDEIKVDEDALLQVGYSAVKEATGINNTDIMLLESHTVYSQSKEKAASRFFIMQCSQSINQEVIQVPLKDVIESLQGPLVKKNSSSWTITPAVVYFHVLPYSEIISQWISRKEFSNSLQNSRVTAKNMMVDIPEVTESYISKDMPSGLDSKPSKGNIESLEKKENSGSCTLRPCDSIKETREMDVDKSPIYPSQNEEKCQNITYAIQIDEDEEKNNPSVQCYSNGSTSAIQAMKVDSTPMLIDEDGINNIASCSKLSANKPNTSYEKDTTDACTRSSNHSNSDTEKLQSLQDSKKILSRTALCSLIRKRNELALQQRKVEDEIAICDEKIERMLTDGKDNFELKIESIIEGCNGVLAANQEGMGRQQSFPFKSKNLSEMQSSCQVDSKLM
ncbi:uncharacterized protein [Cicer arietinum]|uniref:Uncharacterized protein LOC101495369 isoform X2 n=1 Tax=Cicer arietinum TaxID=3827 RepID=A0A3Q7XE82_CICAR|nr:uncharacterized protein LOC101495369 isoform X2 [Cicer arietinum]